MSENILEKIIKKKIEKITNLKKTISSDSLNELFKSNKTASLGIARNFAVNQARGEFMAFCDSDDWWEPFKLNDQLHFLDGSRYSFVCSDFKIVNLITNTTSNKYFGRKSVIWNNKRINEINTK